VGHREPRGTGRSRRRLRRAVPAQPPSPEEIAAAADENDRIAAAFDAAGIEYERVSDELGWQWIEWDWDDPDTQAAVDEVFTELFPPIELPHPCELVDPVPLDQATGTGLDGED